MRRGRRWWITKFYRGRAVGQLGRFYKREATRLIETLRRVHGGRGWSYEATKQRIERQIRLFAA